MLMTYTNNSFVYDTCTSQSERLLCPIGFYLIVYGS